MRTKKETFLEELGELLDAENQIEYLLLQRSKEVHGSEVEHIFWQHIRETHQQVRNLKRCFAVLGIPPRRGVCLAIKSWKKEHDSFLKNRPWSVTMITMFDLSEAKHMARYEIAYYQRLIRQAETLGERACVRLLQRNLCQEESMAQKAAHFSYELAPLLRPE